MLCVSDSIKSLNTTLNWHRINIGLLTLLLLLSVLTHFSKQGLFDYLSLGLLLLYFSGALRSVSMQVLFVGGSSPDRVGSLA